MNLSATIQAYLEAQLSPTEEAQLRAALLNKKERTAEEEALLAMLQPLATNKPEVTWWSDEGVAQYDSLLAQMEAAPPKVNRLTPSYGWRWAGGVAAAMILSFGLWHGAALWHKQPALPSTAPTLAQEKPKPSIKTVSRATPQPTNAQQADSHRTADVPTAPPPPQRSSTIAPQLEQQPEPLLYPQLVQPLAPSAVLAQHGRTAEEEEAATRLQADYLNYRLAEMLVEAQIDLNYQIYLKTKPFPEAEVHFVEL